MARKRTNKNVPAKGRLKEMADALWSTAVKDTWGQRCAVCGRLASDVNLHSHHLIPRQHQATRYELKNGICLCSYDHLRNADVSPHINAAGWLLWLAGNWPNLGNWYTGTIERGDHKRFDGTTNAVYYCHVLRTLREYVEEEEFERIVGVRFAAWLQAEDE